jgi:carbonic anhydrase
LHGTYIMTAVGDNSEDTVFINSKGYRIASDKKESVLGDSLVLKQYKGYYFINVNEDPEWLMRVVKQEENGDLTYMSMDVEEGSFNSLLKNLSQELPVDSLEVDGEKLYQIDPTPKQLIKLIRKGYFKNTLRMKRIK